MPSPTRAAILALAAATGANAVAVASTTVDIPIPSALTSSPLYGKPANNFSCTSTHNPVVMLHGLSADDEVDLNDLQYYLNSLGFCTFSQTYGAHTLVPWVGGLVSMADSAADIASFIREVQTQTGAAKVDLVGHSEGGVMSLYVPLTQDGISDIVERAVALGPAVHGAQYYGFTDLWYAGGNVTRELAAEVLDLLGCEACDDMATGGAVYEVFLAAEGHIVPQGVKASIIMSRDDTLVAPDVSEVNQTGVRNLFVQDYCPDDKVGHAGLAWDTSVWGIILNELNENYNGTVTTCEEGLTF
ncbi:alpha/beta-hydrolase [Mycena galopus ATCC 62051]|nr:alpha/beta-hydrolase [Mycena galopus ATCC 62051]